MSGSISKPLSRVPAVGRRFRIGVSDCMPTACIRVRPGPVDRQRLHWRASVRRGTWRDRVSRPSVSPVEGSRRCFGSDRRRQRVTPSSAELAAHQQAMTRVVDQPIGTCIDGSSSTVSRRAPITLDPLPLLGCHRACDHRCQTGRHAGRIGYVQLLGLLGFLVAVLSLAHDGFFLLVDRYDDPVKPVVARGSCAEFGPSSVR